MRDQKPARDDGWLHRLFGRPSQAPAAQKATERPAEVVAPVDISGLEKQVARLGREQFRLNVLVEAQQRAFQAALEQLGARGERREREIAEVQARRPTELAEARLQVVQRLLPVLDGLDQAFASGERLGERLPGPPPGTVRQGGRLLSWPAILAWPAALVSAFSRLGGKRAGPRMLMPGSCILNAQRARSSARWARRRRSQWPVAATRPSRSRPSSCAR